MSTAELITQSISDAEKTIVKPTKVSVNLYVLLSHPSIDYNMPASAKVAMIITLEIFLSITHFTNNICK